MAKTHASSSVDANCNGSQDAVPSKVYGHMMLEWYLSVPEDKEINGDVIPQYREVMIHDVFYCSWMRGFGRWGLEGKLLSVSLLRKTAMLQTTNVSMDESKYAHV